MLQDIRLAVRQLLASKGSTATALITLALGIGANTGIFTLIHALLLKSLPVSDPARIYRVGDGDNCCVLGGTQGEFSVYSYALYLNLKEHASGFEDLMAYQAPMAKVGVRRAGSNASLPFTDQFVSGSYFPVFGLRAYAGRLLTPDDDQRGAPPVAVISYRAWQQQYGGGRDVLGASFTIDGTPFTIVGIAPPGFFGAALVPDPPDFWMPLATEPIVRGKNALLYQADSHWLYVFGRARADMKPARTEAELDAALRQWLLVNEPPTSEKGRQEIDKQKIVLVPGGAGLEDMKQAYQHDLRLLLGITGLVLLIACANLANLQLARGAAAAGQTSIRVALGAPRARLIRQVLVESTILAVVGGGLGLLVATETADLLVRMAFHGAQFVPIDSTPSLAVLGFAFGLSVLTGVLFGVAPAWAASKADPASVLHGVGRSASGRSTLPQKMLVVLQAALSLVLLSGAGLMVQTLRNLTTQDFGMKLDGTMVVDVNAGFGGYSPERLAATYGEIDRRMRELPGVKSLSMVLYAPMSGNNWQMGATLEERPQQELSPSWDRVSPGFFDAIGAHILRGRAFTEHDTPDSTHVAVINQAFADAYLPNEDPMGKRFGLGGYAHRADYQIVGVVNTIRFRNPRGPWRPMFFIPMLQMNKEDWNNTTLSRSNIFHSIVMRVSGQPSGLAPRIQQTLGSIDPNLTLLRVAPMREDLEMLLSHEELIGMLAQIFGLLALILASVGLYGITAYSVARRTSEIGVRTALGATRRQVVHLILRDALLQAGLGVAVGIPAALAAARLLATELFQVKTYDPGVLAVSAVLLGLCAAAAGLVPAMRASSVDPVQALRVDN